MPPPITYDPLAPATLEDPYPVLAELRETVPVSWHSDMNSWLVTRYADCITVLRDHQRFARDRRRASVEVPAASLSVQSLDPPDQARVRSLFMSALHAQNLDAVQARARSLLLARFERLTGAGAFDVMAEFATPLAVAVVSDLLGVQAPEHRSFARISDAIMRSMDGGLDAALVEPGRIAREQLSALVESWFQTSGRAGLLAHVRAHAPADPETGLYVRNTARVMFQGGYSTLRAAIGNAVYTLLRHPQALEEMRHRRELVRTGAEELVRFDGPVQGTSRIALEPCHLGGTAIDAGQTVTVLFAAANHDPDQFAEPDQLRLQRWPNRHLGYGWGTHACIGTLPAQQTVTAVIGALLDHPAHLTAAGPPQRQRTATMRAFATLPAVFTPLEGVRS